MTFNQGNWTVKGDVYNVGRDLYLTKSSTSDDLLTAIDRLRGEISKDVSIPSTTKTEVLAELDAVPGELAKAEPSSDAITEHLTRAKSILLAAGGTIASVTTFGENIAGLVGWVSRFFGGS